MTYFSQDMTYHVRVRHISPTSLAFKKVPMRSDRNKPDTIDYHWDPNTTLETQAYLHDYGWRGEEIIPGANPARCPRERNIASYSLSEGSPASNVVKPSKKPLPTSARASLTLNSPL